MSVHRVLLVSEVLEIILRVQIGPKHHDVALGDEVAHQDPQSGGQDGANLSDSPEDRPQRGKNHDEEDPDDETDEGGKGDAPGHVVPLAGGLHHEGAEEAGEGQAAVVAMQEGKGSPGLGATHQQRLAGQGLVVGHQEIGAQLEVAEAERALGEEGRGHQEPGPAVGHPGQEPGGTAGELCHQGDLQGLGEEGGEAAIEAQGVGELLHPAQPVTGLAHVQAAAEAQQHQGEQGKEAPATPSHLHQRGLQVLQEDQCCPTGQGRAEGHQCHQGHGQGLVPEQEPLAAVVALRAAGRGPLVLRARGAAGAVCKESLVITLQALGTCHPWQALGVEHRQGLGGGLGGVLPVSLCPRCVGSPNPGIVHPLLFHPPP